MISRPFPLGATLTALALVLAGCATTPSPPRPAATAAAPAGAGHGVYKVGSPYQIDGVWYYPAEDWSYNETGIASWYGEDFDGKYTANGEVFDLNALSAAHHTLPMPSIVQVTNLENGRSLTLRVNDRGPFARGRILDVSRHAAQLLGFEANGTARVQVRLLVPETIQAASLAGRNGTDAAPIVAQAAPPATVTAAPLPPPPGVRVAAAAPVKAPPVRQFAPTPAASPAVVPLPPLPDAVVKVPVKPTQIYIQAGAFTDPGNAWRLKAKLEKLGGVQVSGAKVNGTEYYRVRLGPVASVDAADALLSRVVDSGVPEARTAQITVD